MQAGNGLRCVEIRLESNNLIAHQHSSLTFIVCSSGNDHIGVLFRRLAELLEGWFHVETVLVEDQFQSSASELDVANDSASQSSVRVGVDEELHVEHVAHFREVEDEDTFEENHIG